MVMRFFGKLSRHQRAEKIAMCSHPFTGDATDEKIAAKSREKFNELSFL